MTKLKFEDHREEQKIVLGVMKPGEVFEAEGSVNKGRLFIVGPTHGHTVECTCLHDGSLHDISDGQCVIPLEATLVVTSGNWKPEEQ